MFEAGGALTWQGGQASFPGTWLQLSRERFAEARARDAGPRVWSAKAGLYRPAPKPFTFESHCLDQSPETLALADEVGTWSDRMARRAQNPETRLYDAIARAMSDRLRKHDDELTQDYPAAILALRYDDRLITLVDHHRRDKTKATILHYFLSNPEAQAPRSARADGVVGGGGAAAFQSVIGLAERRGDRAVRLEAVSLRACLAALELGFLPLGGRLLPPPSCTSELEAPPRPTGLQPYLALGRAPAER